MKEPPLRATNFQVYKNQILWNTRCKGASLPSKLALHLYILNRGIFMSFFSDLYSFHHVGVFFLASLGTAYFQLVMFAVGMAHETS